jgi:hypothetical protein
MGMKKTNKQSKGPSIFWVPVVLILAHYATQWFDRWLGLGLQ